MLLLHMYIYYYYWCVFVCVQEEILKWCGESKEGKNDILIVDLFESPSYVLGKNSPVWYVPAEEEARGLLQKYNPFDNDAVELITGI